MSDAMKATLVTFLIVSVSFTVGFLMKLNSPNYTIVCGDGFVAQDIDDFKYDRYYLHYLIDGKWGKYKLDSGVTCTSDSK